MRRCLVVAACVAATTFFWGAGAGTQEVTTEEATPAPPAPPAPAQDVSASAEREAAISEQAQTQYARLLEHMARLEQAQRAHEDRVARELGDRAPVETMAPLATVAPPPS